MSHLTLELDWGIAMKITVEFTLDEFADFQEFLKQRKMKDAGIDDIGLTIYSANTIKRAGITMVSDLISKSRKELISEKIAGVKVVEDIERCLGQFGLTLKI